ncbi:hypothetical protein [Dokdonella sp.]|uniref:hypothetical protein n=1 Tax=Dokdonella sp. TaxID=2291710 RepID=UPI0031CA4D5E|nr:hypothetical protein [Dokdonella sp.]
MCRALRIRTGRRANAAMVRYQRASTCRRRPAPGDALSQHKLGLERLAIALEIDAQANAAGGMWH